MWLCANYCKYPIGTNGTWRGTWRWRNWWTIGKPQLMCARARARACVCVCLNLPASLFYVAKVVIPSCDHMPSHLPPPS